MHALVFSILLVLSWNQVVYIAESVKIVELRVAPHMAEGAEAFLGCRYDLEGDTLFSLSWDKDGEEFYKYVPKAKEQTKIFQISGIIVDRNRSASDFVTLKYLSRESAGVYRCTVCGEGPGFTKVHKEIRVQVDLLPKTGPLVTGLEKEYAVGSYVNVNCTTPHSRPKAQLQWLVNGQPAPHNYQSPPVLVLSQDHPDSYQSKLNLHYLVYQGHYIRGVMTIKCLATIPPLYHKETEYIFKDQSYQTTETPSSDEQKVDDGANVASISVFSLLLCLLTFLL